MGERVYTLQETNISLRNRHVFSSMVFLFPFGRICYKPLGWGAFQPSHEPQVVSLAPEAPAMGATRPRQQEALASGQSLVLTRWMFPKIVGFPPKSSISIGISIINHPFWGTPIFGNTYFWGIPEGSCIVFHSSIFMKRTCALSFREGVF